MFESGNNDHAIGLRGEISRFQIMRYLWPGGNPHNAEVALMAARGIMQPRLAQFLKSHRREASDFEFYVLWNAPSHGDHPSKKVAERAWRFANLVKSSPH